MMDHQPLLLQRARVTIRHPPETPCEEVIKWEPLGKHTDMPGKWKGCEKEDTRLEIYRRKRVQELKRSWRQVKTWDWKSY